MQRCTLRIPAISAWRPIITRHTTPSKPLLQTSPWPSSTPARINAFSTTPKPEQAKNQIFDPVRNENSFRTYLSLSTAANRPLLTLWTASWCSTCRVVEPLVHAAIQSGAGEAEGGVNLAVVEFDAPDVAQGDLAMTYLPYIRSVPTLLAFDARRAEPVGATRVVDARKLGDRAFLEEWIRNEAARHGGGGGGGTGSTGFGGLFGSWK